MKKFLLLIQLISICFFAKAQFNYVPGLIVTQEGDTLSGDIKFGSMAKAAQQCTFRPSDIDTEKQYSPKEAKAFFIQNMETWFVAKEFTYHKDDFETITQYAFLALIEKGALNLFHLKHFSGRDYFFLQKGEDEIRELVKNFEETTTINDKMVEKREPYLSLLSYLVNDCSKMSTTQLKTPYSINAMANVVRKYNFCKNPNATSTKQKHKSQQHWGLFAGTSHYSEITYYNSLSSGVPFESQTGVYLGGEMEIVPGLAGEHLSITLGIAFASKNFSSDHQKTSVKLSHLEFPIYLRYTLLNTRLTPIAMLGISGSIHLGHSVNTQDENSMANPDYLKRSQFNTQTGLGLKYKIDDSKSFIFKYEISGQYYSLDISPGYGGRIKYITLGYNFK